MLTAAARAAFYMATERKYSEIDFCLKAHGYGLLGRTVTDIEPNTKQDKPEEVRQKTNPACIKAIKKDSMVIEQKPLKRTIRIQPGEIEAIFKDDQARVPFTIDSRYHLLDESFPAISMDCPRDIVEEDYSENSCP